MSLGDAQVAHRHHLDRALRANPDTPSSLAAGSLSGFLIKRSKRVFAFATGSRVDPTAPIWPALPPQSPTLFTDPP